MDPSYNNSFGQFGSGVVNSSIVSSGSGDIVLQTEKKKSNKNFIVTIFILLVLAVVFVGVWIVINMTGSSKKELDNESYDRIKTSLIEQTQTINYINNALERGLNEGLNVVKFFQPSTKEKMGEWLETLQNSSELVQELEAISFEDDIKLGLKALEDYKANSEVVLNKLIMIIDAFVNNDIDGMKDSIDESGIFYDIVSVLMKYSNEYKIVAPEFDKCETVTDDCDWFLISNYEYGVGSDVEVVADIFESVIGRDMMDLLEEDEEKIIDIIGVVEEQHYRMMGASDE